MNDSHNYTHVNSYLYQSSSKSTISPGQNVIEVNPVKNENMKYKTELLLNNEHKIKKKRKKSQKQLERSKSQNTIKKILYKRKTNITKKKKKNSGANIKDKSVNIKCENALLNYFSKTTREFEEEKFMEAKVMIEPDIQPLKDSISFDVNEEKTSTSKKKIENTLFQIQEKFDEIPVNQKLKPITYNKPKWSLKIQLQSSYVHISDNEELRTPIISLETRKGIERHNEKIPKILLPLKSKKESFNSCLVNVPVISGKKEPKKNSNDSNREILRFETNKNFNKYSNGHENFRINFNSKIIKNDCQIIQENSFKRKLEENVAPLFIKKIKHNSKILVTQNSCLHSNIHTNFSRLTTERSSSIVSITLPFTMISHVNELSLDYCSSNQMHTFSLKTNIELNESFNLLHFKSILTLNNVAVSSETSYKCKKLNIEAALSTIETYYSEVKILWKFVSMLSQKDYCKEISNLSQLWTDKYKPNSSTEVVGNKEAVLKLKSWLESWQQTRNDDNYSSSEEFDRFNCSFQNNIESNQVAVLIGPHGSGKTASVYAISQELGYKVLEVNASSKRPGKQILKDFEEATKSHRVKEPSFEKSVLSLLKNVDVEKVSQNSLILLEDVDLVFEEDEGFISAVFQLASSTKRPIVMTLQNTCSHLCKLSLQQYQINFQPVKGKKVLALLQLIVLAETGCLLSENCINVLLQTGDLRRCMLQLQYLLLDKERILFTSLNVNSTLWIDMQTFIYKPIIKINRRNNKQATYNTKCNNYALNYLVYKLDNFALISTLTNVVDPTSYLFYLKFEPCMSFVENSDTYCNLENITSEIGNYLYNGIKKSILNESKKFYIEITLNNSLINKEQIHDINSVLSQIAHGTLDRYSLTVDYLSSIRAICRAEEKRNQISSKRGNRFFHYLQKLSTLKVKLGNLVSIACKMFQEKLPSRL